MNIFALDRDPETCAKYHVDRHVIKMISEHTQMFCTVAWQLTGKDQPFKPTHRNHPCTKWLAKSAANWDWLFKLTQYLHVENKSRWNHDTNWFHKSFGKALTVKKPTNLPDVPMTPFALAMDDKYKVSCDPIECYRNYYILGKPHLASWKNTQRPYWYITPQESVTNANI